MFKASIVVRNYNCAAFLPDALESALYQTYENVEVVVVDDGSTDDSHRILDAHAEKCRIVRQKNGGEGSAINAGFATASGDIVLFLDADDVLSPDAVARVVSVWGEGVSRVHFPMYVMNEDGTLRDMTVPRFRVSDNDLAQDLAQFGLVVSGAQSCNAYAAWALRRILPLDTTNWRRAPDCYLNALTASQGRSRQIHTPLGGCRIHTGNLSLQNLLDDRHRREVLLVHPRLYDAIRDFVGEESWSRMTPDAPSFHWSVRLLNFLVSQTGHPFPEDRLGFLLGKSLSATITRPQTTVLRRILLLGGLLTLVALPRRLRVALLPRMARFHRRTAFPRNLMQRLRPPRGNNHWRERLAGSDQSR